MAAEVAACVRLGEDYDGRAFRDFSASVPLRIFERGFLSRFRGLPAETFAASERAGGWIV